MKIIFQINVKSPFLPISTQFKVQLLLLLYIDMFIFNYILYMNVCVRAYMYICMCDVVLKRGATVNNFSTHSLSHVIQLHRQQ